MHKPLSQAFQAALECIRQMMLLRDCTASAGNISEITCMCKSLKEQYISIGLAFSFTLKFQAGAKHPII